MSFDAVVDQSCGVHSFQELDTSRYKTGQLPDGSRQKGQSSVHNRLWAGKEVS